MSLTMNSKIMSARQGNENAQLEMKARLKTALFQCLDTQIGGDDKSGIGSEGDLADQWSKSAETENKAAAPKLSNRGRVPVSALVNRLGRQFLDRNSNFQDKIYFYRIVAELMRQALRDFIGFSKSKKKAQDVKDSDDYFDFSQWDQSIQSLHKHDARLALILELYYMGGMSYEGIASAMALSISDVDKKLRFARAWVCRDLVANKT